VAGRAVRVVTEVPGLERAFDYLTSPSTEGVEVGDRVRVNLHGRSVRAWVVGDGEADRDLKEIVASLGRGPSPGAIAACAYGARRWYGPVARFLGAASPARIVRTLPEAPAARVLGEAPRPGIVEMAPAHDPVELALAAVNGAAARGGSAIILTPSEAWASRLADRLARRGVEVAGPGQWERQRAGWPAVLGARGAALAPVPVVGAGLVLDADDEAMRSSAAPTWHAAELLAWRCARDGASFTATSPFPSPWLRSLGPSAGRLGGAEGWPRVEVVDRRERDPHEGVLSQPALEAARIALGGEEPVAVVCLLQRLGRGRLIACARCGELARCASCGRAEVERDGRLECPTHLEPREMFCRSCGATRLKVLRSGVTTLARDLAAQLATEVSEVTSATSADRPMARVVSGTEAALARVRRCALVVVMDVDQYLLAPRERARRDAVLAVARAGRLVGSRQEGRGAVFVQTRRGADIVLRSLVDGDLVSLAVEEDADARALGLSPYRAHAEITGPGAAEFAAGLEGVEVLAVEDGFSLAAPSVAQLADSLARAPRPSGALRVAVD
jgi:primosomal protein N' (replication factor Y)